MENLRNFRLKFEKRNFINMNILESKAQFKIYLDCLKQCYSLDGLLVFITLNSKLDIPSNKILSDTLKSTK